MGATAAPSGDGQARTPTRRLEGRTVLMTGIQYATKRPARKRACAGTEEKAACGMTRRRRPTAFRSGSADRFPPHRLKNEQRQSDNHEIHDRRQDEDSVPI